MHNRAFMLVPLLEIAPQLSLPNGQALSAILATLDRSAIRLWSE
jgi:2-amino-4-hydroxy-6-hydroxymethyldihydropteridine diphosphokinase